MSRSRDLRHTRLEIVARHFPAPKIHGCHLQPCPHAPSLEVCPGSSCVGAITQTLSPWVAAQCTVTSCHVNNSVLFQCDHSPVISKTWTPPLQHACVSWNIIIEMLQPSWSTGSFRLQCLNFSFHWVSYGIFLSSSNWMSISSKSVLVLTGCLQAVARSAGVFL